MRSDRAGLTHDARWETRVRAAESSRRRRLSRAWFRLCASQNSASSLAAAPSDRPPPLSSHRWRAATAHRRSGPSRVPCRFDSAPRLASYDQRPALADHERITRAIITTRATSYPLGHLSPEPSEPLNLMNLNRLRPRRRRRDIHLRRPDRAVESAAGSARATSDRCIGQRRLQQHELEIAHHAGELLQPALLGRHDDRAACRSAGPVASSRSYAQSALRASADPCSPAPARRASSARSAAR